MVRSTGRARRASRAACAALLGLVAGCTAIVNSKLNQGASSPDGTTHQDGGGPDARADIRPVTGLVTEHGDPREPVVIGERLMVPLDPRATQALIGTLLAVATPCPGGPDPARKIFTCSVAPYTPSAAAGTKLFLVDSSKKEVASFELQVRRLLVAGNSDQARIRLFDADTLAGAGEVDLAAPLAPGAPLVMSSSGRYLAVRTAAGPVLVDLVTRATASLPLPCGQELAFQPEVMMLASKLSNDALPYDQPERVIWCGQDPLSRVELPERIKEQQQLAPTPAPAGLPNAQGYSWLLNMNGSRWLVGLTTNATRTPEPFALTLAPGEPTGPVCRVENTAALPGKVLQAAGVVADQAPTGVPKLNPEGAVVVLWEDPQLQRHLTPFYPNAGAKRLNPGAERPLGPLRFSSIVPMTNTDLIGFDQIEPPLLAYARLGVSAGSYSIELVTRPDITLLLPAAAVRMSPVPVWSAALYSRRILIRQANHVGVWQDFPADMVLAPRVVAGAMTSVAHHARAQRIYTANNDKLHATEYGKLGGGVSTEAKDVAGFGDPTTLLCQP